jgi:hypothetical protein
MKTEDLLGHIDDVLNEAKNPGKNSGERHSMQDAPAPVRRPPLTRDLKEKLQPLARAAEFVRKVVRGTLVEDVLQTAQGRKVKTVRDGKVTGELEQGDLLVALSRRAEVETAAKKPRARKCRMPDCITFVTAKRWGLKQRYCSVCTKKKHSERNRAFREKNREKEREYHRAYYEKNREKVREKVREYGRAYREKNREKIRDRVRAYDAKNREKILDRKRAFREKNREKLREKDRAYYARKKAEAG